MFNKHLIIKDKEGNENLYLFINNDFEFSKEFNYKNKPKEEEKLINNIRNYLRMKKIKFNGKKIFLVVSGIIVATISLSALRPNKLDISTIPKYQYMVSLDKFNEINIPRQNNVEIIIPEENTQNNVETSIPKENTQNNVETSIPKENTKNDTESHTDASNEEYKIIEEENLEDTVNVTMADGTILTMEFEDFIIGVVAAEMPASFHVEALKTQAVATRTYYLKAIEQGKKTTQVNWGQITFRSIDELKSIWGSDFNRYYSKIEQAVENTSGEFITYNNSYIEAVYYSTNNGRTESSLDVWGNYFPYLISVDSPWDIDAPSYLREVELDLYVANSLLGFEVDNNTEAEILSRTDGDSVKEIKIGDQVYTGKYIRELFKLRSTDFDFNISDNKIIITTRGFGHGVGLSQYGSNGMANLGYTYRQILEHYYPNTSIQK